MKMLDTYNISITQLSSGNIQKLTKEYFTEFNYRIF